jgi:hypothetical protein
VKACATEKKASDVHFSPLWKCVYLKWWNFWWPALFLHFFHRSIKWGPGEGCLSLRGKFFENPGMERVCGLSCSEVAKQLDL